MDKFVFNDSQTNVVSLENLAKAFKEVDRLVPAYVPFGFLSQFARAIEMEHAATKLQLLRLTLAEVYNADRLARMFSERYSKIVYVKEFSRMIDDGNRPPDFASASRRKSRSLALSHSPRPRR